MTDNLPNVDEIFCAAIELPSPEERGEYVDRACGGNAELRHRVDALLAAHFGAGDFLERSPATALLPDDENIQESPGTVIGPYKLLQQIGEGGMGVVFMAEQTEPIQRTVALKIIKPGMDTRQVIARFEAERQAVAMMDHPNIARVLDAGTTDTGRPYFVMDLVKGVPITQYCDQQQLPVRERLELMATVCHAVQHAHQKGIIHRDLKPSNVLVAEYDGRPVPKIIDFGVAKATAKKLTEKTMFTELGQMVGTVEYMSPEQARFNQLDIDTRSDVYSLGVLLYELLAGSTPFARKRLNEAAFDEMLRIIREEEPPKPSTRLSMTDQLPSIAANRGLEPLKLNRLVQGELDWIVMKCLEKDRNRRYETASSFAADVERYLNDEAVQACPPAPGYRLRKIVRRHKWAFAVASLIMLSFIAITGTAMKFASQQRKFGLQQQHLAEERSALATRREDARKEAERTRLATESTLYSALIGRAAAMRTARTPGYRREAFEYLRQAALLDVPEKDMRTICKEVLSCLGDPVGLVPVRAPEVQRQPKTQILPHFRSIIETHESGNGRNIAAVSGSNEWLALAESAKVKLLNESGEVAQRNSPLGVIYLLEFSHDGKLLAAGCDEGAVVWSVPDLEIRALLGGHPASDLAFDPSDRQLATLNIVRQIKVWSLAESESVASMPATNGSGAIEFSADGSLLLELTADRRHTVMGWHINGTPEKQFLTGHSGSVPHLAFSRGGRLLASASKDHTVRIWDLSTGRLMHRLMHSGGPVQSVAFAPGGDVLASGSDNGTVTLWDVETGERLAFRPGEGRVWNLDFDASGQLLVSGGPNGINCLKVNRTGGGTTLSPALSISMPGVIDIAVRPNGTSVAARTGEAVYLCDLTSGVSQKIETGGRENYYTLDFDVNGARFFFGRIDGTVGAWDCESRKLAASPFTIPPYNLSYTTDNRWLATHSGNQLKILDFWSGETTLSLPPELHSPYATRLCPEGGLLATSFPGGDIVIWDLEKVRACLADFGIELPSTLVQSGRNEHTPDWIERSFTINRARQYAADQSWDKAAEQWIKAIDLSHDNERWYSPRKEICRELAGWNKVFSRVAQLRPDESTIWIGRAQYRAVRSQWGEAMGDYVRAFRTPNADDETVFEYAGTLLLSGDQVGYQQLCMKLAANADNRQNSYAAFVLARTFGIFPETAIAPQRLIEWAKVPQAEGNAPWVLHVLGMGYYRSGKCHEAIRCLEESNTGAWYDLGKMQNELVLAMAHHSLGDKDQAHHRLKQVQQAFAAIVPQQTDAPVDAGPADWISLNLLLREAEKLITEATPSKSIATGTSNSMQSPQPNTDD